MPPRRHAPLVVRHEGVVHATYATVAWEAAMSGRGTWTVGGGLFPCCNVRTPCAAHDAALRWTVETLCGETVDITGRPKKGVSTCVQCLAQL